ncbi:uncharacterized protein ISCGN_000186 [Ixodes scapularis]
MTPSRQLEGVGSRLLCRWLQDLVDAPRLNNRTARLQPLLTRTAGQGSSWLSRAVALWQQLLPEPHSSLPRAQATTWRQLPTNSYPNPVLYSHIHPGFFTPSCTLCHGRANLTHIIWNCPKDPWSDGPGIATRGQWEAALLSSDPVFQDRVTQRAEPVAVVHALLARRWG